MRPQQRCDGGRPREPGGPYDAPDVEERGGHDQRIQDSRIHDAKVSGNDTLAFSVGARVHKVSEKKNPFKCRWSQILLNDHVTVVSKKTQFCRYLTLILTESRNHK
jgi:hypothetical protein